MGIVKQRSGGGEHSTASIAVAGLALVQTFTVPFSLFYRPSGPADSGRSRPLQGVGYQTMTKHMMKVVFACSLV